MIERRLVKRLIAYWERIKAGRVLPPVESFNPQAVDDLWQNCFQVSVQQEEKRIVYTYGYVGREIEQIFGENMINRQVTASMSFVPIKKLIAIMDKLVADPAPATHEGNFIDYTNNLIKYRSCVLPFSSNGAQVTHFIVGISWIAIK